MPHVLLLDSFLRVVGNLEDIVGSDDSDNSDTGDSVESDETDKSDTDEKPEDSDCGDPEESFGSIITGIKLLVLAGSGLRDAVWYCDMGGQ